MQHMKKHGKNSPDTESNQKKKNKKPEFTRRKEIIKIRAEITIKEMKEKIAKINETKSLFYKIINKGKCLQPCYLREKREKVQTTNIQNERLSILLIPEILK